MVKDHSDSERGKQLLLHGLLFLISSNVFFYNPSSYRQDKTYQAFVTAVMEHWLEQEIVQWIHHEGSTMKDPP